MCEQCKEVDELVEKMRPLFPAELSSLQIAKLLAYILIGYQVKAIPEVLIITAKMVRDASEKAGISLEKDGDDGHNKRPLRATVSFDQEEDGPPTIRLLN